MFNIIKTYRGKSEVIFTGDRPKCNDKLKSLKTGSRNGIKGQRVTYTLVPSDSKEKFSKKPHLPFGKDKRCNIKLILKL